MLRAAWVVAGLVLLTTTLTPRGSHAGEIETGLAIERLHLSGTRAGIIDVESARVLAPLSWDAALWAGYARDPLVLYRQGTYERVGPLVASRVGGSALATLGLLGWLEVGFELPIVLAQERPETIDGGTAPGARLTPLVSAGLGDVRVRARAQLLTQEGFGADVAAGLGVATPTGGAHDYFGERGVTLLPELSASRTDGPRRYALGVAAHVLRTPTLLIGAPVQDELQARAGFAWRTGEEGEGPVELATSVSAAFPFEGSGLGGDLAALEWRGQASYDVWKSLQLFAGGGLGLLPGWGTPEWRAYAGLRFGTWVEPPPDDTDEDGIADDKEARPECVEEPEDVDGFEDADGCPDVDDDQDGVPDDKEARPDCRRQAEDKDGFEDADGCPELDNDQDGLPDTADRCPRARGERDNGGCPTLDADKDGIGDADDRCPKVAEDPDAFEDDDGCPDPDNDNDGVPDASELRLECISIAEDKDGYEDGDGCPDPDNDQDGVLDEAEARPECTYQPEDKDGHEDADGCPDPDNDGDTVLDEIDSCPMQAGPLANRGCPDRDRDADTIIDRLDNCPDETGPETNSGCPEAKKQLVVIRTGKLEILEAVFFATGKDEILERSFPLLDNVAQVLAAHPEVDRLRVEGHTDDKGKAASNVSLSERRAKSVVRYLVSKGIAAGRLEPVGFGPARPIASNKTEEGRAQNRRVEFNVVLPGTKTDTKVAPTAPAGPAPAGRKTEKKP